MTHLGNEANRVHGIRSSPPAILLRESIREGGRVRKRTIANLSALPIEQAEMIRRVLKGEKLGPLGFSRDGKAGTLQVNWGS